MTLREFVDAILTFWDKSKAQQEYIPYSDMEGNLLAQNEIGFTTVEMYKDKTETIADWGIEDKQRKLQYVKLDDKGIVPRYDSTGNFPICCVSSSNRKVAYQKISTRTGEELPIHAGCCPTLDVVMYGIGHSGKTLYTLDLSSPEMHDAIARYTDCSFSNDLPIQSETRRVYEEKGRKVKLEHKLPATTDKGKDVRPQPFYYLVRHGENTRLIKINDIAGEDCRALSWNDRILKSNHFIVTIGADDILRNGMDGYSQVVLDALNKLSMLRDDQDYKVLIVITKADLLPKDDEYLKEAFDNSVEIVEGKLEQRTHKYGFNYEAFKKRSSCIQAFMRERCANFYNELRNKIPQKHLDFCMIASIGSECKEDTFVEYLPFCIDEPILYILSNEGLYPTIRKRPRVEELSVEGVL